MRGNPWEYFTCEQTLKVNHHLSKVLYTIMFLRTASVKRQPWNAYGSKLTYKIDVYNKPCIYCFKGSQVSLGLWPLLDHRRYQTRLVILREGGFKQPSSAKQEMDVMLADCWTGRIQMFGFVPRRCCERATTGGCKALHVERFPVYTLWGFTTIAEIHRGHSRQGYQQE